MMTAGYTSVITKIVEQVLGPRKFSADFCNKFNLQIVRGVILHGTGKTTLVKALCDYFQLKPRIVNGPQLLNSFIGNSEKAVRKLFIRAKKDQKEKGDLSPLHVIVFEEMDSLFTTRTTSGEGSETRNSVVNQLLSILDGYQKLNNILLFGTTNRLDQIDPSLLRGGRFEVTIKIGLPNADDRLEIINFHLRKPRENGGLASDVSVANLRQLVNVTENFSGADLAQIVRIAIIEANKKLLKGPILDLKKLSVEEESNALLKWHDLVHAFYQFQQLRENRQNEIKPTTEK